MMEKIPEHSHCERCHKVIESGKIVCDEHISFVDEQEMAHQAGMEAVYADKQYGS